MGAFANFCLSSNDFHDPLYLKMVIWISLRGCRTSPESTAAKMRSNPQHCLGFCSFPAKRRRSKDKWTLYTSGTSLTNHIREVGARRRILKFALKVCGSALIVTCVCPWKQGNKGDAWWRASSQEAFLICTSCLSVSVRRISGLGALMTRLSCIKCTFV